MINPQSYILRRVWYKSWIYSLNAVCALRPDDTVAPTRAHPVESLVHKNGSFMRIRLSSSPTPTPQSLRDRIVSSSVSSQRRLFPLPHKHQLKRDARFFSVYWLICTTLVVTDGFQTLLRNKCFCNPSDTNSNDKRKYCCIWQLRSLFMVAVDVLNKQSGQPTRRGPPAWRVGDVLTNPNRKNVSCYEIFT